MLFHLVHVDVLGAVFEFRTDAATLLRWWLNPDVPAGGQLLTRCGALEMSCATSE